MHTNTISFSAELVSKVVRCVEDAVGDDIQADIQRNDLQTRNSVPSRIWDLLNTNVIKTLDKGLHRCKGTSWPMGNVSGF